MTEPESQETFDAAFSTIGLTCEECMKCTDHFLRDCRTAAAKVAGEWLNTHGYFNGDVENFVYHEDGDVVRVEVVLTCYGLPLRVDVAREA